MSEKYFKRKGFEFPIVPQNAQGEEILGSLVRALGLVSVSEGKVGSIREICIGGWRS